MRITKSTFNRIIFGVCGGIGEALGWNANIIRLGFVAFFVFGIGATLPVYILLALFLPKDY